MLQYSINLHLPPFEKESKELFEQLGNYNKSIKQSYENAHPFGFFIKNKKDILGGIEGKIWLGSLRIIRLFVQPAIQKLGYGKELLRKAEDYGKQHGALFASLENLCFQQTLNFYLRCGYFVLFSEEGYLENTTMFHLRKKLV
jgi:GNAT superfamily N-acetyltransferase